MYFLLIVVLFMFAFGVSTQSLMYQNQPLDKYLLRRVFMPSYFIIGGEYYTRELIMKSIVNILNNLLRKFQQYFLIN